MSWQHTIWDSAGDPTPNKSLKSSKHIQIHYSRSVIRCNRIKSPNSGRLGAAPGRPQTIRTVKKLKASMAAEVFVCLCKSKRLHKFLFTRIPAESVCVSSCTCTTYIVHLSKNVCFQNLLSCQVTSQDLLLHKGKLLALQHWTGRACM